MKNRLKGYTIIELMIATLIASMVSGVLLMSLSQGNQVQVRINTIISLSERIAIVSNQLEKDLVGAFIPVQAEKQTGPEAETSQEAKEEQPDTKKTAQTEKSSEQETEKKPKLIEKIFLSTNKEKMLDTLTFITNNPLVVFVGKDVGVVKPKVARVQYTLKPESDKKDSFALFRQESSELDLEKYKNVRAYEVIGGIKSCEVTFTARIEKQDEKQKSESQKEEKPKITYEYKTMKDWVSERKEKPQQEDKKESEFPRIPYLVEFKLALWDPQEKRDREYSIICEIPVIKPAAKKEDKKLLGQPKKDEKESQKTGEGKSGAGTTKQQGSSGSQKQGGGTQEIAYNTIETTVNNALGHLKKMMKQGT